MVSALLGLRRHPVEDLRPGAVEPSPAAPDADGEGDGPEDEPRGEGTEDRTERVAPDEQDDDRREVDEQRAEQRREVDDQVDQARTAALREGALTRLRDDTLQDGADVRPDAEPRQERATARAAVPTACAASVSIPSATTHAAMSGAKTTTWASTRPARSAAPEIPVLTWVHRALES